MAVGSHIAKIVAYLLFTLSFLSACASAPAYKPNPTSNQIDLGERVTARNPSLNVTAQHLPVYLGEPITVFRVGIRNTGESPVTFTTRSFRLIDESRRQYTAVMPRDLTGGGMMHCRPRYGANMYWHWPYRDPYFGGTWAGARELECDSGIGRLLSDSLLPMSPLVAGAHTKGLVFFRGEPPEGAALEFTIEPEGAGALTFEFVPDDS